MQADRRILLVEDDAFTRFMMQEIIDTLGAQVDIAEDGAKGCEILHNQPGRYGLVLMDIHMPKLSGVGATKKIREYPGDPPRNVPIIAVTADENYHNIDKIKSMGMDGYMAKPISPGGLLGLIDEYCRAA